MTGKEPGLRAVAPLLSFFGAWRRQEVLQAAECGGGSATKGAGDGDRRGMERLSWEENK